MRFAGLDFYDNFPREFTYTLHVPATPTSHARITGSVSFDGSDEWVSGSSLLVGSRLILHGSRGQDGMQIKLNAPPERRVRVEASSDLASGIWREISTIEAGSDEAIVPAMGVSGFYRLRED